MARQLSNQQASRQNGGVAVTNADGSRWRRGVLVSAGDAANTERTYAENAAHAAAGGQNPDRTRDAKAEGQAAYDNYGKTAAAAYAAENPSAPKAAANDSAATSTAPASFEAISTLDNRATQWLKPMDQNGYGINPTTGQVHVPTQPPTQPLATTVGAFGVKQYARGGEVDGPGTGTSDSIPALLSDGEFVIPAREVRRIGVDALDAAFGTDSSTAKSGHFKDGALVRAGDGLPDPNDAVAFQGALAALRVAAKNFPDRYSEAQLQAMARTPEGRSRLMIEASTVLPKLQAQQQLGDQQTHVNQLADSRKALATQIRELDAAMPKVKVMDPRNNPADNTAIAARAATMAQEKGGDPKAYTGSAEAAINYENQLAHEGVNKDAILRLKQLQAEQQKTDGYINEFAKQGIVAKASAPIDPLAAVTGKASAPAETKNEYGQIMSVNGEALTSTVASRRALANAQLDAGMQRSADIASGAARPRQLGAPSAEWSSSTDGAIDNSVGVQHSDGTYQITAPGYDKTFASEAAARAELKADNDKRVAARFAAMYPPVVEPVAATPEQVAVMKTDVGSAAGRGFSVHTPAVATLIANTNARSVIPDVASALPAVAVRGDRTGRGIMGGEYDEQIKAAPGQLVRTLAGASAGVEPGYTHPIAPDTRAVLNFGDPANSAPVVRGESSFEFPQVSTGTPRRQLYRSESQRKLMSP
jgi:hypothetical protein